MQREVFIADANPRANVDSKQGQSWLATMIPLHLRPGWWLKRNLLPETLPGPPLEDINYAGNQERDGCFNPVWSPGNADLKRMWRDGALDE